MVDVKGRWFSHQPMLTFCVGDGVARLLYMFSGKSISLCITWDLSLYPETIQRQSCLSTRLFCQMIESMDWFKGQFTGNLRNPHISWENPWFPLDFPYNQSVVRTHGTAAPFVIPMAMGCCEATSLTALTMKCWWYHPRPPFEKGHRWRLYLGGMPLGKWAIPPAIYIYIYTYIYIYMYGISPLMYGIIWIIWIINHLLSGMHIQVARTEGVGTSLKILMFGMETWRFQWSPFAGSPMKRQPIPKVLGSKQIKLAAENWHSNLEVVSPLKVGSSWGFLTFPFILCSVSYSSLRFFIFFVFGNMFECGWTMSFHDI